MSDKVTALSGRENFLAQSGKFKRQVIEIEGLGKFEIKEPSGDERAKIYKAAQTVTTKGKETHIVSDPAKLNAWAIILCVYDPTTGQQMFGRADVDTLTSMPTSILDKLAKPVMEFMGESVDEEEAEGN